MNLITKSTPQKTDFSFPEVRVVEASAGSGKTYALAKRYIQLVLHPQLAKSNIPIRQILAITFTNKAAFEMKARIMDFLKKIALQTMTPEEEEELIAPIGLSPEEASQRAYQVMEGIIHHYNFFQVQTIDKFINALLSGCAFKIGLTANFKIKTNVADYIQYSLDQLIDQASGNAALAKIFESFIHHYLYLENRTGWFPKEDILAITHALFSQSNSYGYTFDPGPVQSEDTFKLKREILQILHKMREEMPEGMHAGFIKSYDNFLEKNIKNFDVDSLPDYFARQEPPIKKGNDTPKTLSKTWSKLRKDIQLLCEYEALSLFNPYIDIYQSIMDGLKERSSKDDVLFLSELNKRAGALFDEDFVTVEELYYRLATRFHHYLIDEFQDTSQLQWHNLQKMVEEALSTGGSLFYVGDQKQAIYGFRGGKVELFDQVKDEFNAFNVQTDMLSKNWRSQKAIVEFNNVVFNVQNLNYFLNTKADYEVSKRRKNTVLFDEQSLGELAHIFSSAQQSHVEERDGGYVQVSYLDVDLKEDRDHLLCEQILQTVQQAKERFSFRDIAILTRSNSQVAQITQWLLEEGFPVESERTSHIQENLLIREVVHFLHFLNSPIDNVSFAHFLLSDIFLKSSGLKEAEVHQFVFEHRSRFRKEKDFYLYTEFRRTYPDLWTQLFEEFFKNVGLYPLYELVVSFYHKFGCLKNFPDSQGYFMHFLELIKKQEEEHSDLASFLDYFAEELGEGAFVHITDSDAIKVLTIHKSKGLEFPVVIIPFLGMHVQVGASDSDHKRSFLSLEQPPYMKLLRLKSEYYKFSDKLYEIYANEYRKSLLSELNNIYVALTRAEKELYVFIPKKIKNSLNYAKFLIPEDMYSFGQKQSYERVEKKTSEFRQLPITQYHDWIDYLKDEFQDYHHLKFRKERLKGDYYHFLLSRLGNLDTQDFKKIVQQAQKEGERLFPESIRSAVDSSLVTKMMEAEDIKPFFYCGEAEVFTEREVVNAYGHSKRIDRLIVSKEEVFILDYKSSQEGKDQHQAQVQEYMEIVQMIYKEKRVRGYLFYLDSLTLEEVRG